MVIVSKTGVKVSSFLGCDHGSYRIPECPPFSKGVSISFRLLLLLLLLLPVFSYLSFSFSILTVITLPDISLRITISQLSIESDFTRSRVNGLTAIIRSTVTLTE